MELSAIKRDAGLQCRVSVNKATVDAYAKRMKAGDVFPPLDVFEVDGVHLLVDGWQRYAGAEKAGLTQFPVIPHQGTRQDAIRFAIQSNSTHGLPFTGKDKRHAVEMAVQTFPDDSDRAIADLCKVTHPFVSKVRRQLVTITSCDKRTGRDGKTRRLPKRQRDRGATKRSASQDDASSAAAARARQAGDIAKTGAPRGRREKAAGGAGESDDEFFGVAWAKIEKVLSDELATLPKRLHKLLGKELRKFVHRNGL